MIVRKWIEVEQEIEVSIGSDDIRLALNESFRKVQSGEEGPSRYDLLTGLNNAAAFLNALTDEHIDSLTPEQRKVIREFLTKVAGRFVEKEPL